MTTPKKPSVRHTDPASATSIEKLMQLRTKTGAHHLASADLEGVLQEMQSLQAKIAEQEKMIIHLEQDAKSDPLTGVANRRTFDEELQRSIAMARRYDRRHGLLVVDIDHFKSINDRLGHLAGDAVLQHIAQLLRQNLRTTDMVARIGGDEFCIIMNEIKATDNAAMKANMLMEVVAQSPCISADHTLQVTVSIGHAVFGGDDIPAHILQQADEVMYRQKARVHAVS